MGIRKILPQTTKLTEQTNHNYLLQLNALNDFTEKILRSQLAPARLEYFKAQWSYDSAARLFSTPNKPYPPFPSFEEWNSPHARSERQRIKEVKKK